MKATPVTVTVTLLKRQSRQIQSALDKPRITQPVIYRSRKITSPSNASSIHQAERDHCTLPTHAFAMRSHCVRSDVTSDFTSDFRRTSMGDGPIFGGSALGHRAPSHVDKKSHISKEFKWQGIEGKKALDLFK